MTDDPNTDEFTNIEPAPAEASPAKIRKPKTPATARKMVRILLEENDDIPPNGLFVGHNGRGYLIAPGVPVDVPDFIVEILEHAVTSIPVVDPQFKNVVGWRQRLRYPFRMLNEAAAA